MSNQPIDLSRGTPAQPEIFHRLRAAKRYAQSHGLSAHVNVLRKRNQGFSRWFGLAIAVGAIAALAFVSFFAR